MLNKDFQDENEVYVNGTKFYKTKKALNEEEPSLQRFISDDLSIEEHLKKKFKKHVRPDLGTYVIIYVKLAKKSINYNILQDIVLIGLNVKDKFGNYIYNVEVDENEEYEAVPCHILNFEKYSIEALCNFAESKEVYVPKPPEKEQDFILYMESLCALLTSFMFKRSKNNKKKTNRIADGILMLNQNYKGLNYYLTIDDELIIKIKDYNLYLGYKQCIANTVVTTFIKHKSEKNIEVTNFMSWQIMTETYCLEFRTVRLMLDVINIIKKKSVDEFLSFFELDKDDLELQELKELIPILKNILDGPNENNFKEWYLQNYSGIINSRYLINLRYQNYPNISSLMVGFLDEFFASLRYPLRLRSFHCSKYSVKYYDLGKRKAILFQQQL